jgi:hypothetical protein
MRKTTGTFRSGFLAVAVFAGAGAAGCIPGVGEPCTRHSDCEAGLACGSENKCTTCGDKVACLSVELVLRSCDEAVNPFAGASELQFRVEGDDLTTMTSKVQIGDKAAEIPQIPEGKNRRVYVEAVNGTDVVGRGASGPFDVDLLSPTKAQVVYLRKKGQFSPVNSATSPGTCSEMTSPRAGHTSTLLPDGRVLIVGGYKPAAGQKEALGSVEIYDPREGTFTELAKPLKAPRYGHVTTFIGNRSLPNAGKILVTGGIGVINGNENTLRVAEILDLAKPDEGWTSFGMRKPRAYHTATALESGVVLIAGGLEDLTKSERSSTTEVFTGGLQTDDGPPLSGPRSGHSAVVLAADQVLLVGGTDGAAGLQRSDLLQYLGAQFVVRAAGQEYQLAEGRAAPLAAEVTVGKGRGVLVVGTPASGSTNLDRLWDWFPVPSGGEPPTRQLESGYTPTPRREACIATFDGAAGSGAVVVGGRPMQAETLMNTADVYTYVPGQTAPAAAARIVLSRPGTLPVPKARASCVKLADGSVLVTGGEVSDGTGKVASASAEVLVP